MYKGGEGCLKLVGSKKNTPKWTKCNILDRKSICKYQHHEHVITVPKPKHERIVRRRKHSGLCEYSLSANGRQQCKETHNRSDDELGTKCLISKFGRCVVNQPFMKTYQNMENVV